jgi:hypothetical protein
MDSWGRAVLGPVGCSAKNPQRKKEEFPGITKNMPPGNSFPQICVVSGYIFVGNGATEQEYLRVVALSNRFL